MNDGAFQMARYVYVCYREAVRESKHLILNEFCL